MIVRQDGTQSVIIYGDRTIARLDLDDLISFIEELSHVRTAIRWTIARWANVQASGSIFAGGKSHLATVAGGVPSSKTLCGRSILDDWPVWPMRHDPSPDVNRCSVCARQYQRATVAVAE